ncbi:MAG: penicillin-binding protein 1C, partial [Candidatus Eremiobacteraeota bacterium]|nr:penicillin-binding protein 1C [Candidatus Eremiobacteraeota bacterium]
MKRFVATAALALALAGAALFVRAEGVDVADGSAGRVNAVAFLDRSGMMLGVIDEHGDRSIDVPLAAVSPNFVRAVLAAEDARFYRHGPIEIRSVLRAAWQDFIYGAPVSGASTITMQLARLLDPGATQSKAAQALYAARIELRSSKDAILAAYVNRIPMGGALAGVEAAARAYFGVPAADLDLAQAALLAAIPNDPPQLEPRRNWGAAKIRQRYVLARMVALGWATREAAARAAREPLHLHADGAALIAPHLLFALYPRVANAALPVRTTIDADLQRFVQAQVADVAGALSAEHVEDAAAIVVDNASGEVLAYAGSPDYFSDVALGRNDGVQALRQPGSTLKPFLYELALERGAIEPNSILLDAPVAYAIPGGKLYQPADYNGGFAGPVRVRYALANSLNVPAVRVLSKVGVSAFLARLRALGFNGLQRPASYYGLGLTLGSGEVSLWQLAQAYTTLARRGDAVALTALSNESVAARPIGDSRVWMLVTKMLADPHARALSFGVHSVLQLPFEAAVKTGTSSDYRDTWTVGFTRAYTVATWVGNFDGSP